MMADEKLQTPEDLGMGTRGEKFVEKTYLFIPTVASRWGVSSCCNVPNSKAGHPLSVPR